MDFKSLLRYLWYVPLSLCFVLNMTLLLIIEVLKWTGKGVVYVNNQVSEAGDELHAKATNRSSKIDDLINRIEGMRKRHKGDDRDEQ